MKKKHTPHTSLKELQQIFFRSQLILILFLALFLGMAGTFVNLHFETLKRDRNLQNVAKTIARTSLLHTEAIEDSKQGDLLLPYLDSLKESLEDIDVISIVNRDRLRIYHSNHDYIGTQYDGPLPKFKAQSPDSDSYTVDATGPSGKQHRAYAAIYDSQGQYIGFVMTIMLMEHIKTENLQMFLLFLLIILAALLIELMISRKLFGLHNRAEYTKLMEDLSGTRYLVDSMRANNHDFTNKLHVILGLIQMEMYQEATSYIQNITLIQRENISRVMNAVGEPAVAALLIGKIARASELNIEFLLLENSRYLESDIHLPVEMLITVIGNLLDNAFESMDEDRDYRRKKELLFGIYSRPGGMLITVEDTGKGIPKDCLDRIFENSYSTKGEGRGTGLYQVKSMVENFGGRITVESQEGIGTSFSVSFSEKIK